MTKKKKGWIIGKPEWDGIIKGTFTAPWFEVPAINIRKQEYEVLINGDAVGKVTNVEVKGDEWVLSFEVDRKNFKKIFPNIDKDFSISARDK